MPHPRHLTALAGAALLAAILSMAAIATSAAPVPFAIGTAMLFTPWLIAFAVAWGLVHLVRALRAEPV